MITGEVKAQSSRGVNPHSAPLGPIFLQEAVVKSLCSVNQLYTYPDANNFAVEKDSPAGTR